MATILVVLLQQPLCLFNTFFYSLRSALRDIYRKIKIAPFGKCHARYMFRGDHERRKKVHTHTNTHIHMVVGWLVVAQNLPQAEAVDKRKGGSGLMFIHISIVFQRGQQGEGVWFRFWGGFFFLMP